MKNTLFIILVLLSVASSVTAQVASNREAGSVADITLQEGKIIAYYNQNWQQVPAHRKASYYRKLIAIDADKGYWIQDFYNDTQTKQMDPVLVSNQADILQGHIIPNEGKVMVWFKDGLKKEQSQYQHGQIQSIIKWHRNGQKGLEGYYQQGEKHGVWTAWYQNGNKYWQGSFEKGKRQNLWVIWSEKGKKEREMQFEQGEKIAQWNDFEEEK